MSQLLVSVRNWSEAEICLEAGVRFIDFKEPNAGPLGALAENDFISIAKKIQDRGSARVLPRTNSNLFDFQIELAKDRKEPTEPIWSVALGEFTDLSMEKSEEVFEHITRNGPFPFHFAKVGLSRTRDWPNWKSGWLDYCRIISKYCAPVAVVYADADEAESPTLADILAACDGSPCRVLLVDTYSKQGRGLVDHWSQSEFRFFIERAKSRNYLSAVAGSIKLESIQSIASFRPDVIGVRGAACEHGREGEISMNRIRELQTALASKFAEVE